MSEELDQWLASKRVSTVSAALSSASGFAGRSFAVTDGAELAINGKPAMSLAEIESRIGEYIRPRRSRHGHT